MTPEEQQKSLEPPIPLAPEAIFTDEDVERFRGTHYNRMPYWYTRNPFPNLSVKRKLFWRSAYGRWSREFHGQGVTIKWVPIKKSLDPIQKTTAPPTKENPP